ncbi:hypothetical protein EJB05_41160, partial [Eragrostis curvula]
MATKHHSIDAQLRLLAPGKVSEDDKLVEYDAFLIDRFLDIVQSIHGPDLRELVIKPDKFCSRSIDRFGPFIPASQRVFLRNGVQVQEFYEMSAEYDVKRDASRLDELGAKLASLDPADAIIVASSFSHMLNLANIAEEVQIANRRRNKLKRGDFSDEGNATTESDIEETLKRLVTEIGKKPEEVFEALKSQTVELVLTAHPTQSLRRSLLQKHTKIRNYLTQLYAKDITEDEKKELDEALQAEIQAAFRTDEIRRAQPTPQDEMRYGMSYFQENIWKGVPKFLRRVDTALKSIGINERLPYNAPLIKFSSWMGGDRDGNPRVTPEVTRDVCLLARMMAANLYVSEIEDLMFEVFSLCGAATDELRAQADELLSAPRKASKHYIEFWRAIPSTEPYRVLLGDLRDKLYNTSERWKDLLATGFSEIPERATIKSVEESRPLTEMQHCSFWSPLRFATGPWLTAATSTIADGCLLDFMRQVSTFGLTLAKLDIRQESERHTDAIDAITTHLGIGSYREWSEEKRQEWLLSELQGKRPLLVDDLPVSEEVADVLGCFRVLAELPPDSFGPYIISMATAPSDVLAVELLQRECHIRNPLPVVPLFERLADLQNAPASVERLFSIDWYLNRIGGKQQIMVGYSDSGKDAGRLSAAWQLYQAQAEVTKVAKKYDVKLTFFHGRGGTVGRGGGPTHLAILSQPPDTINGSLRVTIQGEVIEHSFGEEHLCFRTLQRFTAATLEHGMHPPVSPKPEWSKLMDEMAVVATDAYRSVVVKEPRFVEYFRSATPETEYGRMNIGSRPAKRRPGGGITTLRAIPWIFSWTQTRVTLDLLEMVFAKGDPGIAALYDKLLVAEDLKPFGEQLRSKYLETEQLLLQIAGHKEILEGDPYLKQRLRLRDPYITTLNVFQAYTLKQIRDPNFKVKTQPPLNKEPADVVKLNPASEYAPGLEDTLIITMKGIAAGMQNTG